MTVRRLKKEVGVPLRVHPKFINEVLKPIDDELRRLAGVPIKVSNVEKTRLLADGLSRKNLNMDIFKNDRKKRKGNML